MARDIWQSDINRRDFLRAGAALGIGGSALWLAAACGSGSGTTAGTSSSSLVYPKAQIDGDLELFNWNQYLSPDVIKGFESHYGVKVHPTYFNNMEEMLVKLNSGVPYDLTFPTMDYAAPLIQAGQLLPIDHTQLDNWKEVPQYFNDPWYDPKATFSVPYAIWTTGIAWRTDMVPDQLAGSWNDLWTLANNYPGKVWLLYDFQETLGMSLLRKGFDINSGKRSELDIAVNEILQIKKKIRNFSTADIDNLVNGSAWVHHAWAGDVYQVINTAGLPSSWTFSYETCKEGVPTGNDTMAIPKAAKHPGTALKFIDWMLAPENATTNVNYFGYPQVTTTGIAAYQKLVAQYPFLSMTLDTALHGLREIVPTGAKKILWVEEWRKVVYG